MRNKLTHSQVGYHEGAYVGDRCATCRSFVHEDLCKKVLKPIHSDGWCKVGTDKKTGHRYDPSGPKIEGGLQSMVSRKSKE